jgi:hypothetical protein
MGLTEVPSELFRMQNVKTLLLHDNNLCLLPREVSRLAVLETLLVRLSKRSADHDLTNRHVVFRCIATSSHLYRPSWAC